MKPRRNPNNLEDNLSNIAMLGESREDENIDFRIFLKEQDPDNVDRIVHKINKEGELPACDSHLKLEVAIASFQFLR